MSAGTALERWQIFAQLLSPPKQPSHSHRACSRARSPFTDWAVEVEREAFGRIGRHGEMKTSIWDLSKVLLAGWAIAGEHVASADAATPPYANASLPFPTDGNGTSYASACSSAYASWDSASSRWNSEHRTVVTTTYSDANQRVLRNIYYKDATTLCDGHARVPSSPAIPISTGPLYTRTTGSVTAEVDTLTVVSGFGGVGPRPSCKIKPADCDVLWQAYDSSIAAAGPQVTDAPQTPPCANSSQASSNAEFSKSFYGCGPCTVFGQGVQLVYFPVPTTVSRDMCAITPSPSLTQYGPGAVLTAYAGTAYSGMNDSVAGQQTAVVNGHTFTSGTAYISMASVWAEDRCFSHYGSTVSNAILAMPSESVLSLRYSQDHFQYFSKFTTQTGYQVNFADFNEPVPYSAWNGQNICRGADDGWSCPIVYEGQFRPQLAIPPEIKQLSPEWANCYQWYNGLYDPPLALTHAQSAAGFTLPGKQEASSTAVPYSTPAAPTVAPTAQGDHLPQHNPDASHAPTQQDANLPAYPAPSSADHNAQQPDSPSGADPDSDSAQGGAESQESTGGNSLPAGPHSNAAHSGASTSTDGDEDGGSHQGDTAGHATEEGSGSHEGQSNQGIPEASSNSQSGANIGAYIHSALFSSAGEAPSIGTASSAAGNRPQGSSAGNSDAEADPQNQEDPQNGTGSSDESNSQGTTDSQGKPDSQGEPDSQNGDSVSDAEPTMPSPNSGHNDGSGCATGNGQLQSSSTTAFQPEQTAGTTGTGSQASDSDTNDLGASSGSRGKDGNSAATQSTSSHGSQATSGSHSFTDLRKRLTQVVVLAFGAVIAGT